MKSMSTVDRQLVYKFLRRWSARRLGRDGRLALVPIGLAVAGSITFMAPPMAAAAEGSCPNEAVRIEQKATGLAECRGYELVTPPDAEAYVTGVPLSVIEAQSAANGERLTWFSYYPIDSSSGGFINLATRAKDGWTSESVIPRLTVSAGPLAGGCEDALFSEELESAVLLVGLDTPGNGDEGNKEGRDEFCGKPDPPLVAEEPAGYQNLVSTTFSPRSYQLINKTPAGVAPRDATPQFVSSSGDYAVFAEDAPLTEEALAANDLYEWSEGKLHLINVLPDLQPVEAELADATAAESKAEPTPPEPAGSSRPQPNSAAQSANAVASDGSTAFFRTDEKLFARLHVEAAPSSVELGPQECIASSDACTIQVDASIAGGSGGGARFLAASPSGSEVFFVDEPSAELTADTQQRSGENLYDYDLQNGTLADLTPTAHAAVLGFSAINEEGPETSLYFAAEAALAIGATAGDANLYVYRHGSIAFVATLNEPREGTLEDSDWQMPEGDYSNVQSDASPDGQDFAFMSTQRLTGYDNKNATTHEAEEELFLYEAASGTLVCTSCQQADKRPVGGVIFAPNEQTAAAEASPARRRRSMLNGGRVFFTSPNSLAAGVVGGVQEVYEYDAGAVHLISSGDSSEGSLFDEASANGDDVFFETAQGLVAADTNNGPSIYDARVDGGFQASASEYVGEEACASEEACRAPLSEPPAEALGASSEFSGPGNLVSTEKALKEPAKSSKAKTKHKLTRAQKLRAVLKQCAKDPRRKRKACRTRARRRLGKNTNKHHGENKEMQARNDTHANSKASGESR